MANERRINIRFSPEQFDKLDEKRFRARMTFQEIGTRLFNNWLAEEGDVPMHYLRRPADPLIEKLAIIQARGDEGLLNLVRMGIESCYGIMQHSLKPEELEHLKAVAYAEAPPLPKPGKKDEPPRRRGRPRKVA